MNFLLGEPALLQLNNPLVVVQQREDLAQIMQVLGIGRAKDQNIIKEHDRTTSQEWCQCHIHRTLKHCRSSSCAERDHTKLKMASMCGERCLVFLTYL